MKNERGILLVDDDPGVRRMLVKIIEKDELGHIVGEAGDGREAVELALELSPDLVMIDLLMPELDGIETIKLLKQKGFTGSFILLSKITDKMMVEEAYQAGVEFYIHKPINRDEVYNVIQKVMKYKEMEKTFAGLQSFFGEQQNGKPISTSSAFTEKNQIITDKTRKITEGVLMDLGLLSQAGSNDIIEAMEILSKLPSNEEMKLLQNLKSLYQEVGKSYENKRTTDIATGEKAIERRLRRTVEYALYNLANLGIEDYHHPKFERFAHRLFEFSTIREEMMRIRNQGEKKPKLSVKRFLEGMLREIKQEDEYLFR